MTIAWQATATAVQNAINNLPASRYAEPVSLRDTLNATGAAYDAGSLDGANTTSAAALVYKAWSVNTGMPAWTELDRVARYVAKTVGLTQATIAAFGVTSTTATPTPLPWDPTLLTQSTLTGRSSAAVTLATGNAGLTGLLTRTNATWAAALASQPWPNAATDDASLTLTTALQTALLNANTWVQSLSFV
jgi:hypothetical protein